MSDKKRFRIELGAFLAFYLVFAMLYVWALHFTSYSFAPEGVDIIDYMSRTALDYGLKALWTLPVWWLLFRKLSHLKAVVRYSLHLITLPIWVAGWINSYYFISDLLSFGHLKGYAIGWDIYIPILFYILQFGVLHLYDETRRVIAQQKRTAELRELALKSELTAIKAQLNPHFLYNVFNTINASLPPKQEYTRELVAKLADLFRYQLRASRLDKFSLEEEIDFNRTYLELEKARYQDRLQVQWEVDSSLLDARVPPMILQPIVENAIRHGISPKIDGGTVTIEIKEQGKNMEVLISDNGIGMQENPSTRGNGLGLANTRKILDRMYGQKLDIYPNLPNGTQVRFYLPISREQ